MKLNLFIETNRLIIVTVIVALNIQHLCGYKGVYVHCENSFSFPGKTWVVYYYGYEALSFYCVLSDNFAYCNNIFMWLESQKIVFLFTDHCAHALYDPV